MAETITQITQPPKFIEAESKLYLDQLRKAIGGLKGADLSKIMGPQFVAGMDPLTQQAMGMARWSWFLCTLFTSSWSCNWSRCLQSLYVSISTRCYWNDIIRI
jgi:hypothetical protein